MWEALSITWKVAVVIFLAGGVYSWIKSEIAGIKKDIQKGFEKAKFDTDGIGARSKNAEWERYKMQLVMVARTPLEKDRLWQVEQFLKR
jgi:hypothetical protein